jgi:SpoVK/Ycf46/Vps4 family AAA+-type ATPase
VNEFLNHLEETKDHDVVFIGATNRVDALDDAGIRSGRIDEKIQVGEPDREARKAILEQQLGDRGHELTGQDIQFIAGQTDGLVAADLAALVESAAKRTFNRGGDTITMSNMESAVNDSDLVNNNAASTDASTHDIEDEEFGGDLEF